MLCTNPYTMHDRQGHLTEFPCGRCIHCRIQRSREWTLRLTHEMGYWQNAQFQTLTYNDLTNDGNLHKTHLQDYFREIRRHTKIRYFAAGEYGDITGRPHYHLILFYNTWGGKTPPSQPSSELQNIAHWYFGHAYIGTVTPDSIRYVTDYIFDAYSGDKAKEIYGTNQVPFRLVSKGIGRQFIEDNESQFNQKPYLTQNGVKVSIPRYYLKRTNQTVLTHAYEIDKNGFYKNPDYESNVDAYKAEELNPKREPMKRRLQNERNLERSHSLVKKNKI